MLYTNLGRTLTLNGSKIGGMFVGGKRVWTGLIPTNSNSTMTVASTNDGAVLTNIPPALPMSVSPTNNGVVAINIMQVTTTPDGAIFTNLPSVSALTIDETDDGLTAI